ncbi:MAG: hypothetical protein ACJ8EF_04595 [Bradyrhizobium sp.]|jgi:hypothetical protein
MRAVAQAIGAVAEFTAASTAVALWPFGEFGAALLQCAAASSRRVSGLRLSALRCRRGRCRAAAVGAAAAGAYRRGCGYDAYGNWICSGY